VSVRIRIAGAEQMAVLGAELRAAGVEGKLFRRDLLAGVRVAAAPAPQAVKASARAVLPKGGGLNEYVASSRIGVRTRLTGKSVGVRIAGTKGDHNLWRIDAGHVRHKVFGRWVEGVPDQPVTPGFFTKPLEAVEPKVTAAVIGVIYATRRALEKGR
jgi:hypothetical protein